jgi:hypothetical protein
LIVEYYNVENLYKFEGGECRGCKTIFQVILYEGSNNIRFNYILGSSSGAGLNVAGIENQDGTDGLRYAGLEKSSFYNGLSVLFYRDSSTLSTPPKEEPPVEEPPAPVDPQPVAPVIPKTPLYPMSLNLGELADARTLYFPALPTSGRQIIGLVNSGKDDIVGKFSAWSADGELLVQSETQEIPANGLWERELGDLFAEPVGAAYLVFVGETNLLDLAGYSRIEESDGGAAAYPARRLRSGLGRELIIPRIMAEDGWSTEIYVVSASGKKMTPHVYLNDGQEIDLASSLVAHNGALKVVVRDRKATAGRIKLSHIFAEADDLVIGAVVYRRNGRLMAAAGLSAYAGDRLTVPYLVSSGGWWTSLTCYNPADSGSGDDCEVKSVVRVLGRSEAKSIKTVKLGEEETHDLWDFPDGSYALELENPCGLTGIGFMGHGDDALGSYLLPSVPAQEGEFAPVRMADENGWSGLVLYNPNAESVKVDLAAYGDDGKLLAKNLGVTIKAHENLVGLLQTLFDSDKVSAATHVRYFNADNGLYGVLINFTNKDDHKTMTVLPAMQ